MGDLVSDHSADRSHFFLSGHGFIVVLSIQHSRKNQDAVSGRHIGCIHLRCPHIPDLLVNWFETHLLANFPLRFTDLVHGQRVVSALRGRCDGDLRPVQPFVVVRIDGKKGQVIQLTDRFFPCLR